MPVLNAEELTNDEKQKNGIKIIKSWFNIPEKEEVNAEIIKRAFDTLQNRCRVITHEYINRIENGTYTDPKVVNDKNSAQIKILVLQLRKLNIKLGAADAAQFFEYYIELIKLEKILLE